MSQKKKLILNPLPEQTDDYSRYEESETRWDRIIAVLVILALVIGLLIYFLTGNSDQKSNTEVKNTNPAAEQIPALKPEKLNTAILQNKTNNEESVKQQVEQTDVIETANKESEPSLMAKATEQGAKQTQIEDANKETKEGIAKSRSSQVSIHNKAITRSVLTLGIKDKEPTDTMPYELSLPDEGIAKVILFTEMNGLRGKYLYHEWYRNGVRQARVKIPVNIEKQRSHSSKYINFQMLGDWQVKVLDEKQKLYVTAEFRVVLP